MSNDPIEAHPAVAALASTIVEGNDGLRFADGALESVRHALRGIDAETIALHLTALAVKSHRIAGADNARHLLTDIVGVLSEYAGKEQALSQLQSAGLSRESAAAIGASIVSRAPEAPRAPAPSAKPSRGLQK